jgi:hypothetical protein
MELARDVLDKQVRDAKGRRAGRADGIVLELHEGHAPRVAFVEIGPLTLAHRLSGRCQRLLRGLLIGLGVSDGESVRVPFAKALEVGIDLKLDFDAAETQAWAWERFLRRHVVDRIPGGRARA